MLYFSVIYGASKRNVDPEMAAILVVVDPPTVVEAEIDPLGDPHPESQPGSRERRRIAALIFQARMVKKGKDPEVAAFQRRDQR